MLHPTGKIGVRYGKREHRTPSYWGAWGGVMSAYTDLYEATYMAVEGAVEDALDDAVCGLAHGILKVAVYYDVLFSIDADVWGTLGGVNVEIVENKGGIIH
jgi:hypothetical protein